MPAEHSSSADHSGRSSTADHAAADAADEESMDVMGTPAALAPSTIMPAHLRLAFTPSAVGDSGAGGAAGAEDSTFRRLNFTTKECATPGRYDARHKLGQPLAVYCRIKPLSEGDLEEARAAASADGSASDPLRVMTIESETALVCTAPRESAAYKHGELTAKYTFTRMFGPDSTQEEVYLHTTKPMVDSFVAGQNGLIFAYGITASGKTYTMQGTNIQPHEKNKHRGRTMTTSTVGRSSSWCVAHCVIRLMFACLLFVCVCVSPNQARTKILV